jgi:hypothetical protein
MIEEHEEPRGATDAQKLADSIFQKRLQIEFLKRSSDPTALRIAIQELKYLQSSELRGYTK